MKPAVAMFHSSLFVVFASMAFSAVEGRPMHAGINYQRYLQEENEIETELNDWMAKYQEEAQENGWLPQAESRSADEVIEDHKQRFFMAKELVKDLALKNPEAEFSTDSPFTLMTSDEFSTYVRNSYMAANATDTLPDADIMIDDDDDDDKDGDGSEDEDEDEDDLDDDDGVNEEGVVKGDVRKCGVVRAGMDDGDDGELLDSEVEGSDDDEPVEDAILKRDFPELVDDIEDGIEADAEAEIGNGRRLKGEAQSRDWAKRKNGKCMPAVQNQGQCGSCWAFATIAAVETSRCIKTGKLVKYSEQHLATCNTRNGGCNGGAPYYAFEFMKTTGVCLNKAVPYKGGNGNLGGCANGCKKVKTGIKGIRKVTSGKNLIKALRRHPVSIAVSAANNAWKQYRSGIMVDAACASQKLDHAVLAVGFDKKMFKIRNSWGNKWGEKGYIRLRRSGGNGACGMYKDMLEITF